jgi:hypothetical protein
MAAITINEGLNWLKTLRARHAELVSLRNENSKTRTRLYGANVDKEIIENPVYDIKKLDKLINNVAKEIRTLEMKLKATNATTVIAGYDQDDAVLGEVE